MAIPGLANRMNGATKDALKEGRGTSEAISKDYFERGPKDRLASTMVADSYQHYYLTENAYYLIFVRMN